MVISMNTSAVRRVSFLIEMSLVDFESVGRGTRPYSLTLKTKLEPTKVGLNLERNIENPCPITLWTIRVQIPSGILSARQTDALKLQTMNQKAREE